MTKEFDVEANNPFYNLGLTTGEAPQTFKIDQNDINSLRNRYGLSNKELKSKVIARTYAFVKAQEEYAVIGYNLYFHDNGGESLEEFGRFSEINVVDQTGNMIFKIEDIKSDCYIPRVTSNGKYVAYAFGEFETDENSGFRIVSVATGEEVYKSTDANYVSFIGTSHEMLTIVYGNDGTHKTTIVLDQNDGSVYGPVKFWRVTGHLRFKKYSGQILEKKDLNLIER